MTGTTNRATIQARVDAELMEHGVFAPIELLIHSGRLIYADYERWRRGEIEFLEDAIQGGESEIRTEIVQAVDYARDIGLAERAQEFPAWPGPKGAPGPLFISPDPELSRLLGTRYAPVTDAMQRDLFFDNPVVALTNRLVRSLCARQQDEARRSLRALRDRAPSHPDLTDFERLLAALARSQRAVTDAERELGLLLEITTPAKRLLGAQSRDLLIPLWRRLARVLENERFSPDRPRLHASFALIEAQDWQAAAAAVLGEPAWRLHATLCLRLALSAFYRRRRIEALAAWSHVCWRAPEQAAEALEGPQPDWGTAALWRKFLESEEPPPADGRSVPAAEPALTAADFPAWLLLNEPGLALKLAEDLPPCNTPGEERYHCVHRWIQARRAGCDDEEIALRATLQADQPGLFRYLKRTIDERRSEALEHCAPRR